MATRKIFNSPDVNFPKQYALQIPHLSTNLTLVQI